MLTPEIEGLDVGGRKGAWPPRPDAVSPRGGHDVVPRAEALRRVPVVQLPGLPGRSRGGRAAQGRASGAVPGAMGAGPRPGVPARANASSSQVVVGQEVTI